MPTPADGGPPTRGVTPSTIPAVLDRVSAVFPEQAALITEDRRLTFGELRTEARRAAAALIAHGVKAGDHVAIWSPNTWHWVVASLATHYAGAVVVPLNTRYTAEEAADILAGDPPHHFADEEAEGDRVIGRRRAGFAERRLRRQPARQPQCARSHAEDHRRPHEP